MRNLKEIVKDLKATIDLSKKNHLDFPIPTQAGVESKIMEAQYRIPGLKQEYAEAITKNSIIVAVNGEKSLDVANLLETKYKFVVVDYLSLVNRIQARIDIASPSDRFDATEYFHALNSISFVMQELGVSQYPVPTLGLRTLGMKMRPGIIDFLRTSFGEMIFSLSSAKLIADKALDVEFSGAKLGVVLINNNGVIDSEFLPKPILSVVADDKVEVNDEFIDSIVLKVKGGLKPVAKSEVSAPLSVSAPIESVENKVEATIKRGRSKKTDKPAEMPNNNVVKTEEIK